jgi:hypothetical protein
MASIIEMFEKTPPKTGKIDSKGKDKTPIDADGGLNLSKDEGKLKKARGGELNTKKYSDSVKR